MVLEESDVEVVLDGDWEEEGRTPLTGGRERPLESREPDDLCFEAFRRAVGGAVGVLAVVVAVVVLVEGVVIVGDAGDSEVDLWRVGAEAVLAREEEGRGGGTDKGSCDAGGGLLNRRERRRAAAAAAAPSSSLLVAVRDARLLDDTESVWCFKYGGGGGAKLSSRSFVLLDSEARVYDIKIKRD